ncbi:MAG TPA: dihydroneopterin aldolase [Myxococcaceae bacterium]
MSPVDIAIIGGGPAGCSAASWLTQLGLKAALIEREDSLCTSLSALRFPQDWVLGAPHQTLAALGEQYAAHTQALPGLQRLLSHEVRNLDWHPGQGWELELAPRGGASRGLRARGLLVATGLRPRRPELYFPPQASSPRVLDAVSLTGQREQLPPGRVLLMGGGDNAVENALFLQAHGHQVTLWSRSDWRAQQAFIARLAALGSAITQRPRCPLPTRLQALPDGVVVHSTDHGEERFDYAAVLLGYEHEPSVWLQVDAALRRAGLAPPTLPWRDEPRFQAMGLLVAGDASGRMHPCVQTALADGVVAAKQAEQFLRTATERPAPPAPRRNNRQTLTLTGLRFDARVGVLDFERQRPQPIQVDAELNLGEQAVVSPEANIHHVLDYRRARQLIIDECTAEHTELLEALVGKLGTRLMQLHGVVGVRIKVAKLEIFPDCQVAISAELGQW